MVSVFCYKCKEKLSPLRRDYRAEKTSNTQHLLAENFMWCENCKKPREIITKEIS